MATHSLPQTLDFSDGLVGLPDLHRFTVVTADQGPIVGLQSVDEAGFEFAAVNAADVRQGYLSELAQRADLGDDEIVLLLLSVHGEPPTVTANLAGPIVVRPDGSSRQLVLEGPEFPLRLPVGPPV